MVTERVQRLVDDLLKRAEEAITSGDWEIALERAQDALRLDPENPDALAYAEAAGRTAAPDREAANSPAGVPDAGGRRQLSVMFCDLVGSTPIAERLDPEELRDLLLKFQDAANDVIVSHGGHVGKYMGDGILAYFGYPTAREDAARQAARAGLAIIAAVEQIAAGAGAPNEELAARVGIHTGLVVVADMGSGDRRERADVVGETPNIAARLQNFAQPGTVIISETTSALVSGYFALRQLGPQPIRGLSRPLDVFQVLRESEGADRIDAQRRLTPFVGRERELAVLRDEWQRCVEARSSAIVFINGEPGIGKSRLARVFTESIAADSHPVIVRCSANHISSPFYPLIESFRRVAAFAPNDDVETRCSKLEAIAARFAIDGEVLAEIAALLSLPAAERFGLAPASPDRRRQRLVDSVVEWLRSVARDRPTYCLIEDLHWVDASTAEVLERFALTPMRSPVLFIFTHRDEWAPPWPVEDHHVFLPLSRLGRDVSAEMARTALTGNQFRSSTIDQVLDRADGIPLHIEELSRSAFESLRGASAVAVPTSLQDSLMARLDRLSRDREVYEAGSVIGREFSFDMLEACVSLTPLPLQAALARLVEGDILYVRGDWLVFRHALVQEVAYSSMLRSRRRELHGRVAHAIVERFPEVAESQPEIVAHHLSEAGSSAEALDYWRRAARRATGRSAHAEALVHLDRALADLAGLPEGPARDASEVAFQLARGPSLEATHGFADPRVGQAYGRARDLTVAAGASQQAALTLYGLNGFYLVRSELQTAHSLGEQVLDFSRTASDGDGWAHYGHNAIARTDFCLGSFGTAWEHFEGVRVAPGDSPSWLAYGPLIALMLGNWHAAEEIHSQVAAAGASARGVEAATTLIFCAWYQQLCGRTAETSRFADWAHGLCEEHGFPFWGAAAQSFRGWVLARNGDPHDGAAIQREALDRWIALGSEMVRSNFEAMLVETLLLAGRVEEAMVACEAAAATSERIGEMYYRAEIQRLAGEVFRAAGEADRARREFEAAIALAGGQGARHWELRAATSLARLHKEKGEGDAAAALLTPLIGVFEGQPELPSLADARSVAAGVSR